MPGARQHPDRGLRSFSAQRAARKAARRVRGLFGFLLIQDSARAERRFAGAEPQHSGTNLRALELQRCPQTTAIGRSAELALEALRSRADLMGKALFGIKRAFGRLLRAADVRQVPIGNIGWNLGDVNVAMSSICNTVMKRLDYDRIRRQRRENFQLLRQRLQGRVTMLREDLEEGVCPLFFPILVRDKHAAARALWQRGIGAVEFWNEVRPLAERDSGPEAQYLRAHVLELPIHQDVGPSQVEYIADQVLRLELQLAS